MYNEEIIQELTQFQKEISGFFGLVAKKKTGQNLGKKPQIEYQTTPQDNELVRTSPSKQWNTEPMHTPPAHSPHTPRSPSPSHNIRQNSLGSRDSKNDYYSGINRGSSPDVPKRTGTLTDGYSKTLSVSRSNSVAKSPEKDLNASRYSNINFNDSKYSQDGFHIDKSNQLSGIFINSLGHEFFVSTEEKLLVLNTENADKIKYKAKITLKGADVG
jgi:hypothetical protein